jgi:dihydrodipicolinate synthase/N-acetylneuraminate lyase
MIPEFLTGVIAPMFTPCNEDGSLDPKGAGEFARFLLDKGVITTIFARSGLGKMYTFAGDEVKQIIDVTIDSVGGQMGVIPGTAGIWDCNPSEKPDPDSYTEETIEFTQYAKDKGANGVVVVIPEALPEKPGSSLHDRMCEYYQKVTRAVDIPVVIYHPPGVTEPYRMTPALFKNLVGIDGVVGMKYSITDMEKFAEVARLAPEGFALIAGAETAFLPALVLGAVGVIGQGCCVSPELLRAIFEHYARGEIEQAREVQFAVNELVDESAEIDIAVFGKMYAMNKGYGVSPYPRAAGHKGSGAGPYTQQIERVVTEEQYERYAAILEEKLALYPAPAKG